MTGVFAASVNGLLWGAAFTALLAAACVFDLRERRIPNWLVLVLAVLGLAFSVLQAPSTTGIARAAGGAAVGLALWFAPFALRMLGAGDVKLFAAGGTWLGALATVYATFYAALLGGLFAAVWWLSHRLRVNGSAPRAERPTLPYGIPMAIGLALVAWFGKP
jgi:prepilin peptidase CpaA